MQTLTASKQDNLPFYLAALVGAIIATSSIVMLEPAPCDLLFGACLLLLLVTGRFTVMRSVHALVYVGLLLLLFGNLFSLPFAHDPTFAVSYLMITVYLVVSWLVYTALLGRYGKSLVLVVAKAYHIAACVTAGVGVLARFHLIPYAEIFMRDASGMRIKSTFKDPNVLGPVSGRCGRAGGHRDVVVETDQVTPGVVPGVVRKRHSLHFLARCLSSPGGFGHRSCGSPSHVSTVRPAARAVVGPGGFLPRAWS